MAKLHWLVPTLLALMCVAALMTATLAYVVPTAQLLAIFGPTKMGAEAMPPGTKLDFVGTADGERLAYLKMPAHRLVRQEDSTTFSPHVLTSIYFHGRRGNLAECLGVIRVDAAHGMDVVAVDYRGYGCSSGTPSEAGLFLDGEAILRHVVEDMGVPRHRIVLHGFSLGCTVAVHLAALHDDFAALVLEAPFADLRSATLHLYPAFRPLRMFMTRAFNNINTVSTVEQTPVLVTHSKQDECISWRDGQAVFAACLSKRRRFEWSHRVSHIGPHLTAASFRWIKAQAHTAQVQKPDIEST